MDNNIAEEQQREVETKEEADQEAGGLALQAGAGGRQPRQHDDIFSNATITTSSAAGRSGFSSEHYGGTESTVVEGGQLISYEYYEVKNEGVDFLDPKTSPGHVILDVATKRFGYQTIGGELVEQTAAFSPDTSINIIGTSEPTAGRYEQFEYFTKESHDQVLQQKETYFETVYENPEISELYCPKCKVHIHIVLIPNRSDDELRCPTCSEFLRPIGEFSSESSELKNESGGVDVTEEKRIEIQLTSGEINIEDEDKTKNMISSTPVVDPPPSKNLLLEKIATDTSITVITEKEERGGFNLTKEREVLEETDLHLETHNHVDKKPKIYEFCPKCRVCIDKILIRCRYDEFRCPSCFEFLKPIGRGWFFQKPVPAVDPGNKKPIEPEPEDIVHPLKPQTLTPPSWTLQQHSAIKLEILKSIVYGGLIESITSLSVVSSAASAAAATLNIVALALANLIGGLFVIGHNLLELKNDQSRVTSDETDDEQEAAGRYQEVLGQKRNFILHASVAVLSFLVFGLVPPVVYGFSFYKSDERSLKMAAVAAASLACITVLANAKAYVQKPPNWYIYVTTVLHYVVLGVGAAGISYLAGFLLNKLIQKLGWFE
ncbi:membrane protein of ER body 2-like [Juglans regia]|uniref:Membrane protein of ER body 2-like n=2 Tax=Juglans regia TaxID=51240 RepID=A0A6P9EJP9_JUGRE|nr:membrane protein of ER body 2-like [Juglans regia]